MKIRINNITLDKNDLINRINTNKIEAIKHIREEANIGLKDANEIMDNLSGNSDFYDRIHIKKPTRTDNNISKTIPKKDLKEKLKHIDKTDTNNQLYLGFALLGVILLGIFIYSQMG